MLFMAQPDLLYFFIGTLETANALMVDPYPHRRLSSFLHSHKPVLVRIHGDYIVCMALHEELFSSVNVPAYQDAACGVVNFIGLEDKVWVMERAKGEGSAEL